MEYIEYNVRMVLSCKKCNANENAFIDASGKACHFTSFKYSNKIPYNHNYIYAIYQGRIGRLLLVI